MLTLTGKLSRPTCDGVSRRDFLRVGALGAAGLSLADLLRGQASGSIQGGKNKSVIFAYLYGGQSHIDTYDMKPDAPVEFRGEFKPAASKVPGIQLCELMPRQAQLADKFSIVNGLKTADTHSSWVIMTGHTEARGKVAETGRPVFGAVTSYLRGSHQNGLPSFVSFGGSGLREQPAYTGTAHRAFRPSREGLDNLQAKVSLSRLDDRTRLLKSFDNLDRQIEDLHGDAAGLDKHTTQALEIIRSNRVRDAFDVYKEPASVRDRYKQAKAESLLAALRLVEAGVRVVTLSFPGGSWDSHTKNFDWLRRMLPPYDQAVSALIGDLYARGLDKDVLLVVCGEFGRTPKVDTKAAGRGHWPESGSFLVAGGGLRMGQVIGQTDSRASRSLNQPLTSDNLLATIYRHLDIDPTTAITDATGRPRHLLEDRRPIKELI